MLRETAGNLFQHPKQLDAVLVKIRIPFSGIAQVPKSPLARSHALSQGEWGIPTHSPAAFLGVEFILCRAADHSRVPGRMAAKPCSPWGVGQSGCLRGVGYPE